MTLACPQTGWAAASPARAAATETCSDETLMRRIATGDQLAMRTLFARYRVAIYRGLVGLVGDRQGAEELLSVVSPDFGRKASSFAGPPSVSIWLWAIPRHKALSARRRRTDVELDGKLASALVDPTDGP